MPTDQFKVTYFIEHEVTVEASPLAVALYNEYRAAYARSIDLAIDLQTRVLHANDARAHFNAIAELCKGKILGEPKIMDLEHIPK